VSEALTARVRELHPGNHLVLDRLIEEAAVVESLELFEGRLPLP
jgi:hypothetical protein